MLNKHTFEGSTANCVPDCAFCKRLAVRSLPSEVLLDAVKQAAVSGVIEPTYDKLPDAVKYEFSFKTFERLVAAHE